MGNTDFNDSFKKVSVSSMITYFRGLPLDKQENIIKWARTSKNPNANINTANPSEWEKNLKSIFSQLSPQDQNEVILQVTKIADERKANK